MTSKTPVNLTDLPLIDEWNDSKGRVAQLYSAGSVFLTNHHAGFPLDANIEIQVINDKVRRVYIIEQDVGLVHLLSYMVAGFVDRVRQALREAVTLPEDLLLALDWAEPRMQSNSVLVLEVRA